VPDIIELVVMVSVCFDLHCSAITGIGSSSNGIGELFVEGARAKSRSTVSASEIVTSIAKAINEIACQVLGSPAYSSTIAGGIWNKIAGCRY
jgi:hypothetical protein